MPESNAMPVREFDEVSLLERLGNDAELYRSVAELFAGDYPAAMASLDQAVLAGDARAVRVAAHAILGTLLNLSADPAIVLAREIESQAARGELDGAAVQAAVLKEHLERLAHELSAASLRSIQT